MNSQRRSPNDFFSTLLQFKAKRSTKTQNLIQCVSSIRIRLNFGWISVSQHITKNNVNKGFIMSLCARKILFYKYTKVYGATT